MRPSPWIERLNLMPHPEGGFYSEIYRSHLTAALDSPHNGERALATCIYYLLPSGAFSAFHRLKSDEIWTHLDGGTIHLHIIDPGGVYTVEHLGVEAAADAIPAVVIPANSWFAAEPAPHTDGLVACFVAPGFQFEDFEMAKREYLSELCPAQKDLISRLSLG